MSWPEKIYVATQGAGVFYTENFEEPPIQPTWTPVNLGLPTLDCLEFALDQVEPKEYQYVLLNGTRTLYKRHEGLWTKILGTTDLIWGGTIGGFCVDQYYTPDRPYGRIWAVCGGGETSDTYYTVFSDDRGLTWTKRSDIIGNTIWTYGLGTIRAYGDNLFVTYAAHLGAFSYIGYSTDAGQSWGETFNSVGSYVAPIVLNPSEPDRIYVNSDATAPEYGNLSYVNTSGSLIVLQPDLIVDYNNLWFSSGSGGGRRAIVDGRLYTSDDGWLTTSGSVLISPAPVGIAQYTGKDANQIILALGSNPHVIGCIYGEDDSTALGIAGGQCDTAPFDSSIPDTSGGIAIGGIQAFTGEGGIRTYGVSMPGYTGTERGEPMDGDRSAWDVAEYPERHAIDLGSAQKPVHHVPSPTGSEDFIYSEDGLSWSTIKIPLSTLGVSKRETILTFNGELTPCTNPFRLYNKFGTRQVVEKTCLSVAGAPIGANLIVDIYRHTHQLDTGESVWGIWPEYRPTVTSGSYYGESTLSWQWGIDEFITARVAQVGSTYPGSYLVVHILHSQSSYSVSSVCHAMLVGEPSTILHAMIKTWEVATESAYICGGLRTSQAAYIEGG